MLFYVSPKYLAWLVIVKTDWYIGALVVGFDTMDNMEYTDSGGPGYVGYSVV